MKTLVLFEKIGDKTVLEKFFSSAGDCRFVALSPEAGYELEKAKVPFKIPVEYFPYEKFKALHVPVQKKLDGLMSYLDEKAREHDERFRRHRLSPFYYSAYKFKMLIDNVFVMASELNAILKEENPKRVVYCAHKKVPVDDTLCVDKRESVYGQILSFSPFRNQFSDIEWVCHKGSTRKTEYLQAVGARILKATRQWFASFGASAGGANGDKRQGAEALKILVGEGRNLELILGNLYQQRIYPLRIARDEIKKIKGTTEPRSFHWAVLMADIAGDKYVEQGCSLEGCNYFELFEDRIQFFLESLEGYYRLYEYFLEFFKKHKIRLVLQETFSPHIVGNDSIVEAARRLNIPTVCWVHGGSCSVGPSWEFIDYRFSDYYLVYGDKMKEFILRDNKTAAMDVRVVGCPYIENIRNQKGNKIYASSVIASPVGARQSIFKDCFVSQRPPRNDTRSKPRIVYAVMNFLYNEHYLGWAEPDYRDTAKWAVNRRILDVLGEFQDRYDIILKLLSGQTKNELFKQYLRDKGLHNIKVVERGKMIYHMVPTTDVFVLDYVSTGFFEAAAGGGDIFVYSRLELPVDAIEIIKTRAHFERDLERFLQSLRGYLKDGQLKPRQGSSRFVEEYLNIKDGQDNISNAVMSIVQIIEDMRSEKR